MRHHLLSLAFVVLLLGGCGAVDSMRDGFAHAKAVSTELEKTLGLKSFVGFNWSNGSLNSVDVTFNGLPDKGSLADITAESKRAVLAEFKQKPKQIIIAFAIEP